MLFISHLKTFIQLFFFPFLFFFSYCHSVVYRVVCFVPGGCNQSFFVLFNVVLESLYRCVNAVFIDGKSSSSLFSWYIITDKMKRSFFPAAVVSILLYGCTTWTLTKRLEKKLDGNYSRMLRAILNKSRRQHPTKYQLYSHLPPITKTLKVRRTRHAGHCWTSRDELIGDLILWILTYGRPARTYIQQLCEDTGCSPENLPEAMNDREKWRERVRDIRAGGTTWWGWWWLFNLLRVFLVSINWWAFTGVWVTANLLRPPGLFWVFYLIPAMV